MDMNVGLVVGADRLLGSLFIQFYIRSKHKGQGVALGIQCYYYYYYY